MRSRVIYDPKWFVFDQDCKPELVSLAEWARVKRIAAERAKAVAELDAEFPR